MAFVLDASVTCAWAFADEVTPALTALLAEVPTTAVFVAALWRSEVMNTLLQASRRGRISTQQIEQFWSYLERLHLRVSAYVPPLAQILSLCQKHNLTAYDAEYLALALWHRVALATLDMTLATAAQREGIDVRGR